MSVFVVMLRAIGPVTHKIMSMAQWREVVAAAGFEDPQTYVATGNMITSGEGTPAALTRRMGAIVRELGLGPGNTAILRTPRQLQTLVAADPFPDMSATHGSEIGVHFFADAEPDFDWVADYAGPEKIHILGRHLIINYAGQQSSSRLPALVERRSGTVTARNWNTLRALAERSMARQKSI